MQIRFHKMHGAGNDFVLIDDRAASKPWVTPAALAAIATRRMGIGSEGVILLCASDHADFRMRFFNPDGSEAELCGNGARCVACFAHAIGAAPRTMRFETPAGLISAALLPEGVQIAMPPVTGRRAPMTVSVEGRVLKAYAVVAGVPHLVMPVEDVRSVNIERWGRMFRNDPAFAPQGTNVDFISRRADGGWDLRTYERGVEAESGACGTGAVASATIVHEQLGVSPCATFHTRDGFMLRVCVADSASPLLEGPATEVFRGEIMMPDPV